MIRKQIMFKFRSDEENNVIIQDNDNINMLNMNYNAEDGFEEEEI